MIFFGFHGAAMSGDQTPEQLDVERGEITDELNTYIESVTAPEFQHHDVYQLRIRRKRIEEMAKDYRRVCSALKRLADDEDKKKKLSDEYFALDNKIMDAMAKIDQRVAALEIANAIPQQQDQQVVVPLASQPLPSNYPVTWGKFYGDELQWDNFKQKFELGMHNLKGVDDGVKMQFLVDALQGRAAAAMAGFKLEAANYTQLWDALIKKYENKYTMLMKRFGKFFSLPAVERKKASSKELETMINYTNDLIRSVGGLGYATENWDLPVIYVLQARLHPDDRNDWETHRKGAENPKVGAMLEFLDLQMTRAVNRESAIFLPDLRVKLHNDRASATAAAPPQKPTGGTYNFACGVCNSFEHRAFECNEFTTATYPERRSMALKQKICFICLKRGHYTNSCESTYRCKERACVANKDVLHDRWLCPNKDRPGLVAAASFGQRTSSRYQQNLGRDDEFRARSASKRSTDQS